MNRPIEWVARHDRIVVVAALGAVVVLAWGLLLAGTGMDMPGARASEHTADAGSLGRFLAVLLMWAVMMVAMMRPSAAPTILLFGALTRVAAGVYQWTPLKHACLRNCRSPIHFVTRHWRAGLGGAFRLGLFHGAYCVGCCWALMGLLFVGGVMNVAWVAALAVFVLLEKTTFLGTRLGRAVSGVGLVAAGAIALTLR